MKKYLTNEQVLEMCPAIGAEAPTRSLSDKYVHVNTLTVINDLRKFGWVPVSTNMRGKGQSIFSKHQVILEHPDITFDIKGDLIIPQIVISNSHDGLSSFKFSIGLFRMVCSNGLIVPLHLFGQKMAKSFSIRHIHYGFDQLRDTLKEATQQMESSFALIERLMERELNEEEKRLFAKRAFLVRNGVKREEVEEMLQSIPEETVADLLVEQRVEDQGDTAWKVFNRVQEWVIGGGFRYVVDEKGTVRKARSIDGFERRTKVNSELFESLAEVIELN